MDGPAITYLLVGMFLLLGLSGRPTLRAFMAGAAFSLAITCNIFVIPIAAALVGAWLLFGTFRRGIAERVRAGFLVVAGLSTVQLALGGFMAMRFPRAGFGFMWRNFEIAEVLVNGDGRAWFVSFGDIVRGLPYIWVPIFAGIASVVVAFSARSSASSASCRRLIFLTIAFMASCWVVFITAHNRGLAGLSLPFYLDFFIPAFVLVATVVVGEFMKSRGGRTDLAAAVAIAVLVLATVFIRIGVDDLVPSVLALALGAMFVLSLPLMRLLPTVTVCIGLATLFALPFVFIRFGDASRQIGQDRYVELTRASEAREFDVYRHAVDFQDGVIASVPLERSVGFWYDDKIKWLTSVQSTFLWGYSRLVPADGAMPKLDTNVQEGALRYDYLVLLDPADGPIEAGAKALCRAGVGLRLVKHKVLDGDALDLRYAIYERRADGLCGAELVD